MTYTVKFYNTQIADNGDALTLEDVYRKYAAFGGIHACEFDNDIDSFDTGWDTVSGVDYSGDELSVSTSGVGERITWFADNLPHSYTMEFTYQQGEWGALLRGDGASNYYRIFRDSTAVSVQKIEGGVQTTLWSRENSWQDFVGAGRIKISVRDAQTDSDSTGRFIFISIWLNDKPLYTIADAVATNTPPLRMGLVISAGVNVGVVYSDFRIPNMGELVMYSAMSPGDSPDAAIQHAIEDRYIRAWVRWNGKLRAYRPHARAVTGTVPMSKDYGYTPTIDKRQSFSHLRLLGAFQWVQLIDNDLVNAVGHRFRELNNTSLWSADDCQRIAKQMFIRCKEQVFQAQIQTIGLVFNEIEDRVKFPNPAVDGTYIDYIVDSVDWTWNAASFDANVTGRRYYWGEP